MRVGDILLGRVKEDGACEDRLSQSYIEDDTGVPFVTIHMGRMVHVEEV